MTALFKVSGELTCAYVPGIVSAKITHHIGHLIRDDYKFYNVFQGEYLRTERVHVTLKDPALFKRVLEFFNEMGYRLVETKQAE